MKSNFSIILIFLTRLLNAQEAGNANYQNQIKYPESNINLNLPNNNDIVIDVKGMANVKADAFVAVFNVVQVGKTTDEVNSEIDKRINSVLATIQSKSKTNAFVDMLTFVPVYEYQIERKLFNKRTYNEIPVGFELKKNIHIEYQKPEFLSELIAICAQNEIYDLVKVEYFSSNIENVKKELIEKAKLVLKEKEKKYSEIMGKSLADFDRQLADVFSVKYPAEMYNSYQAYSSNSMNFRPNSNVNTSNKSTTLYYQPIVNKEFDFVMNPNIIEPVIQVMYEIKLRIVRPPQNQNNENKKEFYIVTPNGEMKPLNLN